LSKGYDWGQAEALRSPYHNERAFQEAIPRSGHQCPALPVRRRHGRLLRRVRLSAGTFRASVTSTGGRKRKSAARVGPTRRSSTKRRRYRKVCGQRQDTADQGRCCREGMQDTNTCSRWATARMLRRRRCSAEPAPRQAAGKNLPLGGSSEPAARGGKPCRVARWLAFPNTPWQVGRLPPSTDTKGSFFHELRVVGAASQPPKKLAGWLAGWPHRGGRGPKCEPYFPNPQGGHAWHTAAARLVREQLGRAVALTRRLRGCPGEDG